MANCGGGKKFSHMYSAYTRIHTCKLIWNDTVQMAYIYTYVHAYLHNWVCLSDSCWRFTAKPSKLIQQLIKGQTILTKRKHPSERCVGIFHLKFEFSYLHTRIYKEICMFERFTDSSITLRKIKKFFLNFSTNFVVLYLISMTVTQ